MPKEILRTGAAWEGWEGWEGRPGTWVTRQAPGRPTPSLLNTFLRGWLSSPSSTPRSRSTFLFSAASLSSLSSMFSFCWSLESESESLTMLYCRDDFLLLCLCANLRLAHYGKPVEFLTLF